MNGTKSKSFTVLISLLFISLFGLFATTGFVPNAAASTPSTAGPLWWRYPPPPPPSCKPTWVSPSGTYPPGVTIVFKVTDPCKASGSWKLISESTGAVLASGTFKCPCKNKILFAGATGTSPLLPGTYELKGAVGTNSCNRKIEIDNFVVTNALPFGTIAAAGASLVGLLAVKRYTKILSFKTPKV